MKLNDEQKKRLKVAMDLRIALEEAIDDVSEAKRLAQILKLDVTSLNATLVDLANRVQNLTVAIEEIGEDEEGKAA